MSVADRRPMGASLKIAVEARCMSETPHEAFYVWNLLKALPQVLLQNDPA